ncbi:hypothetical protein AA12717_2920 [Gluconacetobacter sacchari DSM 12717]|nr:hypothetical protein AA12717_2920 [Gluconacetobacter sacchari DSM 12717]
MKQMMRHALLFLFVGLSGVSAHGQAPAGFSGTWRLDADESDYRDLQQPEQRTDRIVDRGDRVTDVITAMARGRTQHVTLDLPADGRVVRLPERTVLGTGTLRTVALRRDGAALVVTQEVRNGDTVRVIVTRWALSADRTRLAMRVGSDDDGPDLGTLVFDRAMPGTR